MLKIIINQILVLILRHLIDKQKLIKQRYKSLLEIKKTIKSNIDLVYNTLKKLPNESQPKLIELLRLGITKGITKIDVNKIKNVNGFIHQLKIIIIKLYC